MRELTIKEKRVSKYFFTYTFNENDYTVTVKQNGDMNCTCFNGSNFGVNGKQNCRHKRLVKDNLLSGVKKITTR